MNVPANIKTVAIIGAGPVGLAAAAHVLERGLTPLVLEAGPRAGDAVRQWSHVQLFSPWQYAIDQAAERLLTAQGWTAPDPQRYPTGGELLERYLDPLAARLSDYIRTSHRVTGVTRLDADKVKTRGRDASPFELRCDTADGTKTVIADAVIDTSGTWLSPNPAGANGLTALGEDTAADRIAYGMPDVLGRDRSRYAGRSVAVLGAGHSAIGTLIDLARLAREAPGTQVTWLMRGEDPAKAFGGGANDALPARGELGSMAAKLIAENRVRVETGFRLSRLEANDTDLAIVARAGAKEKIVVVDQLIVATGFRPDFSFLRELRLAVDPALECPPLLAPMIDPNVHSCGTVRPHGARELAHPEHGFYIAGMKSYGRAPTFLLLTGYEQVRSIVAEIAGDHEAAARVELVLPETGVCSGPSTQDDTAGCCGGAPKASADACCRADEEIKNSGGSGCGCGTARPATPEPALA